MDDLWLSRLSYLAAIFDRLNSLNASLQGSNISPFTVKDKINATIKKLELLVKDVKNKKSESFPSLEEFVTEKQMLLPSELTSDIQQHCLQLVVNFKKYFPENYDDKNWIRNPFSTQETFPASRARPIN